MKVPLLAANLFTEPGLGRLGMRWSAAAKRSSARSKYVGYIFRQAQEMSSEKALIFGRQLVAARGLLKLTQAQLAEAADVGQQHLAKIEAGLMVARPTTVAKLRDAIEHRGVEFTNGGNPGVRFKSDRPIQS